jgi:pilus assembly protein CpaB
MRPKSLILILFALGCGLVASIGISQVMESRARNGSVEMQQIYVALVDVPQRTALTPDMVKLEEWPKERVPLGAITKLESLEGRTPRHPLYAGEPILENKLIDPQKDLGVVSEKIRAGFRAISVKVDNEVGAAGLILPGDRVDVLVFLQKRPPEVPQTTTKTILRNVTVFAVNDQTSLETDKGETSVAAKTVTLEVKPSDAERLTLAQSLGRLRLILRRGDDAEGEKQDSDGVLVRDLFGDRTSEPFQFPPGQTAQNATTAASSFGQGFLQMLNNSAQSLSDSADSTDTGKSKDFQTMLVMTPSGVEEFTWDKVGELPRELRNGELPDAKRSGTPAPATIPVKFPPFPIPATPPNQPTASQPTEDQADGGDAEVQDAPPQDTDDNASADS